MSLSKPLAGCCQHPLTLRELLQQLCLNINLIRSEHKLLYENKYTFDTPISEILKDLSKEEPSSKSLRTFVNAIKDNSKKAATALRLLPKLFGKYIAKTDEISEICYYKFQVSYIVLSLLGKVRKWLKWHIACLQAKVWHQEELPPTPDFVKKECGGHLYSTQKGYRFVRDIIREKDRDIRGFFAATIGTWKKSFPEVYDYEVKEACIDTVNTLRKENKLWGQDIDSDWTPFGCESKYLGPYRLQEGLVEDFELQHRLMSNCYQVGLDIGRVLKQKNPNLNISLKLPSFSGHHEATRKDFGSWNRIQELFWHTVTTSFVCAYHEDGEKKEEAICGCGNHHVPLRFFNELTERMELLPASTVGLKEPLKIRVITKGPVEEYFLGHQLQRLLFEAISNFEQFTFTGKPVNEDDLLNIIGGLKDEKQFYVSGDYSDATNNLYAEISTACAQGFAKGCGLSPAWERLFVRLLCGYEVDGHEQKRGQLMGSPVSFPILCMANLATFKTAVETQKAINSKYRTITINGILEGELLDYKKNYVKTKNLRVAVNGDDIAFVADTQLYVLWRRAAYIAGLEASFGKNFTSRDFVCLNSTMFTSCEPDIEYSNRIGTYLERTPSVNIGLIYSNAGRGRERKGYNLNEENEIANFGDYDIDRLGSCHHELMETCPQELQELVTKLFIQYNKKALDKVGPGVPYFAPKHLGGVGLKYISNNLSGKEVLSDQQREFLRICQYNIEKDGGLNLYTPDLDQARVVLSSNEDLKFFLPTHIQENMDLISENERDVISLWDALENGEIQEPQAQKQKCRELRKKFQMLFNAANSKVCKEKEKNGGIKEKECVFVEESDRYKLKPRYNPWAPVNIRAWLPFGTDAEDTRMDLNDMRFSYHDVQELGKTIDIDE